MADWSESENERTITAYLEMLTSELRGEPYRKVDFYRPLSRDIGRTEGSVERKFSNISAVLAEVGSTFVDGYKPLANVQGLLRQMVHDQFAEAPELRRLMIQLAESAPPTTPRAELLGDPTPIPVDLVFPQRRVGDRRGRFPDFNARESRNSQLGAAGERLVVQREQRHLAACGRQDLAARVRHLAVEEGDGLGFDVLSYRPDGVERFVEVKTTVRSAHQPFYVSRNEVEFSSEEPERFVLARVFRLGKKPGFYELPGALAESTTLVPESYTALPRIASH